MMKGGGAERDERREVKTKRKVEDEASISFHLLIVWETLRQYQMAR